MVDEIMVDEEIMENVVAFDFGKNAKYALVVGVSAVGGAIVHQYLVKPIVKRVLAKIEEKKLSKELQKTEESAD